MPLAKSLGKPKSIQIQFDGETVTVRYRPAVATRSWFKRLRAVPRDDENADEFLRLSAELLAGWDVTDDDGKELPITVATLDLLPLTFVNAVVEAVYGEMFPKAPTSTTSSSG